MDVNWDGMKSKEKFFFFKNSFHLQRRENGDGTFLFYIVWLPDLATVFLSSIFFESETFFALFYASEYEFSVVVIVKRTT